MSKHVFHTANKFPGDRQEFHQFLDTFAGVYQLCWIPFESKHGVFVDSMVYDPLLDVFF